MRDLRKKVRIAVIVLLALVFTVSLAMFVRQSLTYRAGQETYAEAEELVGLPDLEELLPPVEEPEETEPEETATSAEEPAPVVEDPYARTLQSMDFTALREVNSDVLGWIVIPGTVISYPLVQGADNQYYLKHTWKKQASAVGAIFLEYQNSPDLSDFNTIVYGHRMNNGSMFASLKEYKKQSWWKDHPCVYITDDNGSHTYEIFAAYEVSTSGAAYQLGFPNEESRQAFLDDCVSRSVIDTGIAPTVRDQILTLSTCTGNGHATRWVVQAVLRGEAPQEAEAPLEELPPEEEEKKAPSALDIALGRATGKAEEPAS